MNSNYYILYLIYTFIYFCSKIIIGVVLRQQLQKTECDEKKTKDCTKNSAFVFIKPHANTIASQKLVQKVFNENGIVIKSQGELTGEQIDKGNSLICLVLRED